MCLDVVGLGLSEVRHGRRVVASGRCRLCPCLRKVGLGLFDRNLIVAWIKLNQFFSFFDELRVVNVNPHHDALNPSTDRGDVAVDLSVFG